MKNAPPFWCFALLSTIRRLKMRLTGDLFRWVRRARTVLFSLLASCTMATVVVAAVVSAVDDSPAPVAWLSGAALTQKLAQPGDVFWQGTPLRETLGKFSRAQRVAILIDRRVDPSQRIEAALRAVPVGDIIEAAAADLRLGHCRLGPVVYLGPPEVTRRLRTVAEILRQQARQLPTPVARKLLESKRLEWDDFAEPRELLRQLAASVGIEIDNIELVPHDLWAAADLPPLPLTDRMTLIAGAFDLTLEISGDGKTFSLVPVPDEVAIVRSYPAGSKADDLAKRYSELAPDAGVEIDGTEIRVEGLLEDHEKIATSRSPAPPSGQRPAGPAPEGETRFTANVVKKPARQVIEHFARQLGFELAIDEAALSRSGISLDTLVSFSVKEATLDELLTATLEPVGCRFARQGKTIRVVPK